MTTKLVCTVGIGDYKETAYYFGDMEEATKFAQIGVGCRAIAKDLLELVVLLTDLPAWAGWWVSWRTSSKE